MIFITMTLFCEWAVANAPVLVTTNINIKVPVDTTQENISDVSIDLFLCGELKKKIFQVK